MKQKHWICYAWIAEHCAEGPRGQVLLDQLQDSQMHAKRSSASCLPSIHCAVSYPQSSGELFLGKPKRVANLFHSRRRHVPQHRRVLLHVVFATGGAVRSGSHSLLFGWGG